MNKKTEEIKKKVKLIEEKKIGKKRKNLKGNIGLKISLDLISPMIAGVLIGLGFDKIFLTKPIFFLIFLLLGIIAGLINVIKAMNKLR